MKPKFLNGNEIFNEIIEFDKTTQNWRKSKLWNEWIITESNAYYWINVSLLHNNIVVEYKI